MKKIALFFGLMGTVLSLNASAHGYGHALAGPAIQQHAHEYAPAHAAKYEGHRYHHMMRHHMKYCRDKHHNHKRHMMKHHSENMIEQEMRMSNDYHNGYNVSYHDNKAAAYNRLYNYRFADSSPESNYR